ncbi:hypothetical protein [Vulcanisaeta sp. JCM 14467]
MDERLVKRDRLEQRLRGRYSDEVINDLLRIVEKFINYWYEAGNEIRKLMGLLRRVRPLWAQRRLGRSLFGHFFIQV